MEKQKIKITIEKGKQTVCGCCSVNNNLIVGFGKNENAMKHDIKKAIFDFEEIPPHLIEFEEEYI